MREWRTGCDEGGKEGKERRQLQMQNLGGQWSNPDELMVDLNTVTQNEIPLTSSV